MYKLIKKNEQIMGAYKEENGCRISFNFNLSNTDYAQYLAWLEEGNTPDPADPIPEPVELSPAEKLASAGLTVDELKVLLGIA